MVKDDGDDNKYVPCVAGPSRQASSNKKLAKLITWLTRMNVQQYSRGSIASMAIIFASCSKSNDIFIICFTFTILHFKTLYYLLMKTLAGTWGLPKSSE